MKLAELDKLIIQAEYDLSSVFSEIELMALENQEKVMNAFSEHKLTSEYFAEHTGYGIDDAARNILDSVFAQIYGAESAALRLQMVSGTHALACVLLGNLKSGDELLNVTGAPYDTMHKVIGLSGQESGSLLDLGITYKEIDLIPYLNDEQAMFVQLEKNITTKTSIVYIQKSCGYSIDRPTLLCSDIERIVKLLRKINTNINIMVDNCYGELVEEIEPLKSGANIIAGSLIKNPGGGLAISGGYFAGDTKLVERALNRLTAPGIGGHLGVFFNQNRLLFQGLFLAPQIVANALKSANLFAYVFHELGFMVKPLPGQKRGDIIQAIKFGQKESLVNFFKALQQFSPVDSHVNPEPADMPGYEDKVIMAGGTFVEGSTIELSGDGPLREPYVAYVQGALSYMHAKLALSGILQLAKKNEYRFF